MSFFKTLHHIDHMLLTFICFNLQSIKSSDQKQEYTENFLQLLAEYLFTKIDVFA